MATHPYETKRLAQEIAGGIAETGCIPFCIDLDDSRYGDLLKKYLKANCSAETRAKIARFIEWLTIGAGVPGCMHGGGSPDGAKMIINAKTDLDHFIKLAKNIIQLDEDILVEYKKK